jgi:DNA ligase-1
MKRFAALYGAIDATTKTSRKVAAMEEYFREAPPEDAAWATYFLRGGKLRAPFPARLIAAWACELAGIPGWLFGECYEAVGDLAETAALLLPDAGDGSTGLGLAEWVEQYLVPLRSMPEPEQRALILESWSRLTSSERFVWNKLITGAFRVGVSDGLVLRALAGATGVPAEVLAHRLAGAWFPSPDAWAQLVATEISDARESQPYPFYLAYPLDAEPETLGNPAEWIVEHKWDGIRAQVIRRNGATHIWSRGGEQITERFPEILVQASHLPDGTVVDGELLGWREDRALPFADLQHRITRKKLSAKFLESVPARLMTFDLLEYQGRDIRPLPLRARRQLLESLPLHFSPRLPVETWDDVRGARGSARESLAEGVMLKRLDSPYGVGREKGQWWKWKIDPWSVDAVLIYAQRGHGRRASLFTDYTFGVWDGDQLVPFAKAYSGLTDAEIRQVDSFIRRHTIEKFGPVCTVEPQLVFEIAFEGIQRSTRHKSGVAVRFPRMARWRTDKSPKDADTIETVRALLPR